ncbi:MAG: transposase, partial [Planctomycetota bacterium]
MTNHVHMILVPELADSLGQAMRTMHTAYTAYVNRHQGFSGHLWQGRFHSCPMDESHLWSAIRYVERNPVRAGLVRRAEEYPWSSARGHCGIRHDAILADDLAWPDWLSNWRAWLRDEDEAEVTLIRKQTKTGRPWGPKAFIGKLERLLGRSLTPSKRGPKPRNLTRGRSTSLGKVLRP